jgi:probable rRNA maturation factor
MKNKINIQYSVFTLQKPFLTAVITKCIESTLNAENIRVPCEINVLVADDQTIQTVNNTTRGIDRPTDVLSFPMFELEAGVQPENWDEYTDPDTGRCPLGDMVISLERAIAQAKDFGHSVRREVGYLTIHSVLHLLGYDHLDEGEEKRRMRAREEAIAATISRMGRD